MITSTKNKRVTEAARLKKRGLREQHKQFLIEGAQATAEGIAAGAVEAVFHVKGSTGRVPEVVAAAEKANIEIVEVSDSVMAHLTSAVTPQGLVAIARLVDVPSADLSMVDAIIPVLCSVRDPGNAGTILRSADAAGATGVVFTRDSVDVYNSKTVRASAGSLFHLPIVRDADPAELLEEMRDGGAQVLAADASGQASVYETDLTRPTVLLLGNEAWGLRKETLELADKTVRVPIRGDAESLNLAAAAALLLFEAARQRGGGRAELAAVIAASVHDLRLPLTAVKGFTSTLVDRWEQFDEKDRRDMVSGMLLDLDRLAGMVTQLVDVSRLELGGIGGPTEKHDLGATLESIASAFERSPDYPEVVVSGKAEARIDPARFHSIIIALCEGAMWWGQDGPIEIEATMEGSNAVVVVKREGEAPDDPESMFAGPAQKGGRIGLHMAKRVVEALGGTLTAEGGRTITFRVELLS